VRGGKRVFRPTTDEWFSLALSSAEDGTRTVWGLVTVMGGEGAGKVRRRVEIREGEKEEPRKKGWVPQTERAKIE